MIDYTKLPYTERLLYVSHLQKQQSTAWGLPSTPGRTTLPGNAVPPTTLAAGGTVLSEPALSSGVSLEKLLYCGLLLAGAGLLAYGLYQHLSSSSPKLALRKEEDL